MNQFNEQCHADDLDELRWQDAERRRMERSNQSCGYVPQEGEDDDH